MDIHDKQLHNYMNQLSVGAVNKELPNWVWNLNSDQSQKLLNSMVLGDGSYNNDSIRYYTSSKKLANDVTRLALHCGWSANMYIDKKAGEKHKYKGREIITKYDSYRISINKGDLL